MTKRTDDQIPVVPSRGAAPAFPARQPERTVTEDAVLQHETPLHKMVHGGMVDSLRRLVNVFRSGSTELVDNLFKRGVNNLDDVLDSSIFRRVKSGATDASGNIDLGGSGWVNKILDNIGDGTTYGRLILTYLSLGKLIKVLRSGSDESVDNLFKRGVNTIDDVLDSATFHRTTPNEKTGAGRAFSAIDGSSNAVVTTIRAGSGTAPVNTGVVTVAAGAGIGIVSRSSNWQAIFEHDSVDKQFRIDNTTGSVNFHHGPAASVSANNFMSALNKDVTFHGNVHVGGGSNAETGNPKLEIHGGTGAAGSGRTGSLQVDAANRHLNLGSWNGINLWVNVGDEADPTTGTLGIGIGGTGIVTIPTQQLNITGSHGLKFDTKDAGSFADTTYMYLTDYSTGLKGLRVKYGTGDMYNKDGNNVPGVVVAGTAPSGTMLHGTLWCQI